VLIRVYSIRRGPERLRRSAYTADEIDAVAAYCSELDSCFLVPMADIAGRQDLLLRVEPTRNNQVGGVNMASAYELGAVAQLGERRHGMAEVRGSSPLSSTSRTNDEVVVGAHQFREKFGYWMERAAAGEEILITRRGRRYARLGPPDSHLVSGDDGQ
jgi:prevent-host-death family protein